MAERTAFFSHPPSPGGPIRLDRRVRTTLLGSSFYLPAGERESTVRPLVAAHSARCLSQHFLYAPMLGLRLYPQRTLSFSRFSKRESSPRRDHSTPPAAL